MTRAIPFTSLTINHWLAFADAYMFLEANGQLHVFEMELREPFMDGGKERKFCPDIFFIWKPKRHDGGYKARFLEVQLADKTSTDWAQKHTVRQLFFKSHEFTQASFHKHGNGKPMRPKTIIWSRQRPTLVLTGATDEPFLIRDLADLLQLPW